MRFILLAAIFLSLNICANCYFLSPAILDPLPTVRTLCWNNVLDNAQTLDCGPTQSIKIISAIQVPSTSAAVCPNQFIAPITLVEGTSVVALADGTTPSILPINPCQSPISNNATANLIRLCNGQATCTFSFSQILSPFGLRCLNPADGALLNLYQVARIPLSPATVPDLPTPAEVTVPIQFTNLQVNHFCDGPRKRFRPFSNKRYDPKFSPSLFHTARHPSNNRFVA
jgi:hypothetical protein